jgi:hypothetical protein
MSEPSEPEVSPESEQPGRQKVTEIAMTAALKRIKHPERSRCLIMRGSPLLPGF